MRSDFGSVRTIDQLFPSTGQPTSNFDPILANYIQFPDGRRFTFQYDPYGELARINLPTGGAIKYDYGDGHNAAGDGFEGVTTDNNPVMIYRRLQQRREYANGGSSFTSKTQYTTSYQWGNLTAKEQVYDPTGNLVGQTVHTLHGSPLDALNMGGTSCNAWNEGLETQTDYGAPNPQVSSQTTTLDDTNQVSKQAFAYDAYNNLTDLYEYDWGSGNPGSLIRHTQTVYFWTTNATFSGTGSYLVQLPYYRIVYDGGGNQVAETSWHYDENPVQDAPGISGHDSNYGTGWNTRGNATSEWQWLKNQSGSWTAVGTIRTFDIAGNVLAQQDPNGNATTFAYNDDGANEYAFPTSIRNALGQTTRIVYDYYLGKPVQTTDASGTSTDFSYNDPLDRVTQVLRAAGAGGLENQTNYSYPTPNQVTIKQDQKTEGDGALSTAQLFDGLGRESATQQSESSSSFIEIDKSYDALGRMYTVSNPYRPGDSIALTIYLYDTLGRTTSVTTPDGAVTSTSYSGQYQVVNDAAGKSKRYWYDAAER
jgi:YD repeat-containing protein